jgi:drug/metabolite transporter (DMT)-like permease
MWIIFALSASVLWGLSYILFEQIYKKISVATALAIVCFFMFFVMLTVSYFKGALKTDLATVAASKKLMWLVAGGTATAIIADVCIAFSIVTKNATLAGLVEISYPLFIALFAYLLFKENQLTLSTIFGGLLIFGGIAVIYFFNK